MSWLPHVVVTAPSAEPVTLDEAKRQVHVDLDDSDFDADLTGYIAAARSHIERTTGTKLITQTVLLQAAGFTDLKRIPIGPLLSVASVKYLDAAGAEQTVDPSVYELVTAGLRSLIRLKPGQSWPGALCAPDAVRVAASAGYGGAAANVPPNIRHALLLIVGDWFRGREDTAVGTIVNSMPNGAAALLANHRMP